ncbi:nuclease-related domain-containing protein [Bacillus salipaludis]|uniref:Nuclease-related domain-containing protein n=1 Tax=Bacillus salipaludis TaxID=2547811 RepID=A0AA90TTF3_9BACI|nr:nuclease-related domain-containing protein [Bacillus salipaludis]MDQ6599340.1 nuclease-related domain-containing protein [Bacillus salipaludis]
MIQKKRTIPLVILILEVLLRRLPLSDPRRPQIFEELNRRKAGFKGEQSLDYYFSKLDEKKIMIFHDLNLPDGDYNCQIDTLILSPEFALIIEIKNMAGKLVFDSENGQFFQIIAGKEKGYTDPISQSERHRDYIKNLLAIHHLPPVPVDYIVVVSNPYSILEFRKSCTEIKQRVCKADNFLKRFKFFENRYSISILDSKDLRKLTRLLLKLNTPPTNFILKKYGIQKHELLTGVHCPLCSSLPLKREKRKWYCPSCDQFSTDAHLYALQDYFLVMDSKITNKQFRDFIHIQSIDTSKRLLKSAPLFHFGKYRLMMYYPTTLPWINK